MESLNVNILNEKFKRAIMKDKKIVAVLVFGSYAKGEETNKSDIDLLVVLVPQADIGLLGFIGIQEELEKALGRKVDLVTAEGVSPYLKDEILSQAQPVYER